MKSLTSAAIVALTAAMIGGGFATTALAQQGPGQQGGQQQFQQQGPGGPGQHGQFRQRNNRGEGQGMRMGGLLNLVCSERGAEQLEVALVRLSHRVELTAEQQPLFDELKSTALTAQTAFADQCAAARPTASADAAQPATPPDMLEGMQARLAVEKAHIAALESVLPKFEAFYNSLTDEQKAQLRPERRGDGKGPGRHMGQMPPMQPGQETGPDGMAPPPVGSTQG